MEVPQVYTIEEPAELLKVSPKAILDEIRVVNGAPELGRSEREAEAIAEART